MAEDSATAVLQHGYAHHNHTPNQRAKSELGRERANQNARRANTDDGGACAKQGADVRAYIVERHVGGIHPAPEPVKPRRGQCAGDAPAERKGAAAKHDDGRPGGKRFGPSHPDRPPFPGTTIIEKYGALALLTRASGRTRSPFMVARSTYTADAMRPRRRITRRTFNLNNALTYFWNLNR